MNTLSQRLCLATITAILVAASSLAWAHHGWAWAEDEQTEITGTILDIHIAPPHPRLMIRTANDGEWRVDLGNPGRTERAGFVEGVASPGDTVVARGHRSRDAGQKLFKAVRITIGDAVYTFYPERVVED